jgi:hypothetical protein
MLSRRERVLIHILVWTCLAAAAGLFVYREAGRQVDIRRRVALMEEQLVKFTRRIPDAGQLAGRKERLRQELEEERKMFYAGAQMDPYRFGIIVRDLVAAQGLQIDRYQTMEIGGRTLLEFSVRGDALGFLAFLRRASLSDHYWSIPFVSINARGGGGVVQSVFRIHYEQIGDVAD